MRLIGPRDLINNFLVVLALVVNLVVVVVVAVVVVGDVTYKQRDEEVETWVIILESLPKMLVLIANKRALNSSKMFFFMALQ